MLIKPFLKWAGGKYRIIDRILRELPQGLRLVEPFAGSCAVYLNSPAKSAFICDINSDLVALYLHIQRDGKHFIEFCQSFFTPENNTKERYLEIREEFNASSDNTFRAACLLYLNRHAFNGLVRYNAAGAFNVPFGKYKKPYFPLKEMLAFYNRANAVETEFARRDFRDVFLNLRQGDVVYCDPPYVPLSKTSSFTAYSGNGFSYQDQLDLAGLAGEAQKKGIFVLLSNHDTELTRNLYSKAEIKMFNVQRLISCNGSKRVAVPELLAIYR